MDDKTKDLLLLEWHYKEVNGVRFKSAQELQISQSVFHADLLSRENYTLHMKVN